MNYDEQKTFLRGLRATPERYSVAPWSVSGHCCFAATVLDTDREWRHSTAESPRFYQVAECFHAADAERVARVLNDVELLREAVDSMEDVADLKDKILPMLRELIP